MVRVDHRSTLIATPHGTASTRLVWMVTDHDHEVTIETEGSLSHRVDARKIECIAACATASENPSKCSQKRAAVAFNCVLCKIMHHHAAK